MTITIDDAINDGLYQKICQRTGQEYSLKNEKKWLDWLIDFYGDGADQELRCIPLGSKGNYINRALITACMMSLSVKRLSLKSEFSLETEEHKTEFCQQWFDENIAQIIDDFDGNSDSYFGMDFGRSGDITCIFVGQIRQDLTRIVPLVIELRNTPFAQQQEILINLISKLPRFTKGALDARGNGNELAESLSNKYRGKIEAVMTSEKFYDNNFPKYKAAFENKAIIIPSDVDILNDHKMIELKSGKPRIGNYRLKGRDGGYRHGDAAIAGLMFWYASSQDFNLFSADFGINTFGAFQDKILANSSFVL
jgi:phage FluMu gp28-like protein